MWEHRGDLQGHQLKAIVDHWKPFVYDIRENNETITAKGLNMDVLNALENKLNFTTHLIKGNNSWSSMINLVHEKTLDFAATGFSQV